jgi:hypothetical protein
VLRCVSECVCLSVNLIGLLKLRAMIRSSGNSFKLNFVLKYPGSGWEWYRDR